jgi:hypothetical protein
MITFPNCGSIVSNVGMVIVLPNPTITGGVSLCQNSTLQLTGSGTAAAANAWASSNTAVATITNAGVVNSVTAGSVVITYTNSVGCVASLYLTVHPTPNVSAGQNQTICAGGSLTLNGSGASSYSWNNGVSNGVAFTPQSSGTYIVAGVDVNGCQNTDTVVVNIAPVINATINVTGCDSVLWNNQTYYSSSTLQFQNITALGCDSNTVVNIILSNNTSTVDSIITCGSYAWSLNGQTYNQSGIYIAQSIGINGCDSLVTLVLTINNPPNPPIVSTAVNLNQGIYFTTPSQNDVTYQWLTCPNYQEIPGETSNIYDPVLNGNYVVIVTNACGSDTSECIDLNSVFDMSYNMDIVLFPNPTFSVVNVIGLKDIETEFEIFDGQGRVLKKGNVSSANSSIDLNSFAAGIYLIKIKEVGIYEIMKE